MLLIFDTLYSRKKKEAKSAYKTKKFIKLVIVGSSMKQETVTIPKEEYTKLKKKAEIADDIILQLESSLKDAEAGRIRRVA